MLAAGAESIHFPISLELMFLPHSLTLSITLPTEAVVRREGHKESRNFYHTRAKNLRLDLNVFIA